MRSLEKSAMILGALSLIACGTSSDTSTSPRLSTTPPSFSIGNAGPAVGDQVIGTATIALPTSDNLLERYSVNAFRHPDGSVSGVLDEFSELGGGHRTRAHVVCFTVTGNSARLAAQIDQSDIGPVGSYVVWSVIDNGAGTPDQTTDIFFGGTESDAQFHCSTGFSLPPYFSSVRGNLQVR